MNLGENTQQGMKNNSQYKTKECNVTFEFHTV